MLMKTGNANIDATCLDTWHINRSMRTFAKDALRPLGLNVAEAIALIVLSMIGGEGSQRQLLDQIAEMSAAPVEDSLLDKGLLTRTMQSLEGKNYIVRSKNPNDSRSYLFALTKEGMQFKEIMFETMSIWVDKAFCQVSKEDIETCAKVIKTVKENLSKESVRS